jgi:hypothetical protein
MIPPSRDIIVGVCRERFKNLKSNLIVIFGRTTGADYSEEESEYESVSENSEDEEIQTLLNLNGFFAAHELEIPITHEGLNTSALKTPTYAECAFVQSVDTDLSLVRVWVEQK